MAPAPPPSTPPPPTPPPPPAASETDLAPGLVGYVLSALAFGALFGVAVITVALWIVVTLQAGASASDVPNTAGPAFVILIGGTLLGAMAAVVSAWTLLGPVETPYRRGMLATVSGFATIAAMLTAIPVHQAFGRAGLVGLAVACGLGCLWLGRRMGRWARRTSDPAAGAHQ